MLAGFRFYNNCFTQLLESLQQGKPRSSNIGPADSGTDADSIFILEKAGDPFMGPLAFFLSVFWDGGWGIIKWTAKDLDSVIQ